MARAATPGKGVRLRRAREGGAQLMTSLLREVTSTTPWLLVVCVANTEFVDDPEAFLRDPKAWPKPDLVWTIVRARTEDEAYDKIDEFDQDGTMTNWYVSAISEEIAEKIAADRYTRSADPNQLDMFIADRPEPAAVGRPAAVEEIDFDGLPL
jgi:hypothetical protein